MLTVIPPNLLRHYKCEVWGSQGRDYYYYYYYYYSCPLRHDAVQSGRSVPMFQWQILPTFLGYKDTVKTVGLSETSSSFHRISQCHSSPNADIYHLWQGDRRVIVSFWRTLIHSAMLGRTWRCPRSSGEEYHIKLKQCWKTRFSSFNNYSAFIHTEIVISAWNWTTMQ